MIRFNRHVLERAKSLCSSKNVYVAFSGGVDSLVVAHHLRQHGVGLFHVNHNVICDDKEIAHRAAKLGGSINMAFHEWTNHDTEVGKGESIEAVCHEIRHRAFKETGGVFIVCHHLDDAVESYFLNWLRGHIDHVPLNPIVQLSPNAVLCRPFLLTRRDDITRYAVNHGLLDKVVKDPLNEDCSKTRNWARKVVLPVIADRYRGLPKVVAKKVLCEYAKLTQTN
jgi:tRNA(Ile)-lysidine synthase TilS/MesJ